MSKFVKNITLDTEEKEYINKLLGMAGDEIYSKYGLKRDETITHTADFGNGVEIDVKLVICEDDKPYTEAVGFINGFEAACSDPEAEYVGEWKLEINDDAYIVNVN